MLEVLFWGALVVLFVLTWLFGYYTGKLSGIREVEYLLDEQWRGFNEFCNTVFEIMKIEVDK